MLSRRQFVQATACVIAGFGVAGRPLASSAHTIEKPSLTFGMMSDVHYADIPIRGTRHYQDSLAKLQTAIDELNKPSLDFAIELGDFIDASDGSTKDEQIAHLRTIESAYADFDGPRHYVLGNHCLKHFDKDEFAARTGLVKPYYSFDADGWHFVILDACYTRQGQAYASGNFNWTDAYVPAEQLEWLTADLEKSTRPTVVFIHQCVDGTHANYNVHNHAQVRAIFERAGNVAAVFQGHHHRNVNKPINGIQYCIVRAMVEGSAMDANAYSRVSCYPDGSVRVDGFVDQTDYHWPPETQSQP